MNYNDTDDDIFKEKQQSYSLIKHDAIEIIYQPITDDDIFKLERGDCKALSNDIYNKYLTSSELWFESSFESLSSNESNSQEPCEQSDEESCDPINVDILFLKSLSKRRKTKYQYLNMVQLQI
ncbi:unnamed protein product [Rotaria sordida]|uniref:Uncharacterized protein n=1 Tax=Rotaria sordida TaxID=392033 RepID=A0A815V5J8_9BILA|nr:unnamed protein product [Rotaria sordida]